MDQAEFGHPGLEIARAHRMVDRLEFSEHRGDGPPSITMEVRHDPGAEVLRLAHIEHRPVPILEQIHAGAAGEPPCEIDLAVVG